MSLKYFTSDYLVNCTKYYLAVEELSSNWKNGIHILPHILTFLTHVTCFPKLHKPQNTSRLNNEFFWIMVLTFGIAFSADGFFQQKFISIIIWNFQNIDNFGHFKWSLWFNRQKILFVQGCFWIARDLKLFEKKLQFWTL